MKFIFYSGLLLLFFIIFPCTDFLLVSEDQTAVKGRTLDFSIHLPCALYIFPQNTDFKTLDPDQNIVKLWKTKYAYASIGIYNEKNLENFIGSTYDFDGVNEEGLTIEGLWHREATYPKPSKEEYPKSFFLGDISDYILGMCSTLDEVKDFLNSHIFWFESQQYMKDMIPTVHFMISDNSNKSIVCEFIKGKIKIYEETPNIITNSPSYEWHIENLRNYVGKINIDTLSYNFKDFKVKNTSYGTGLHGIPGDFTSPSRFVKTFLLSSFSNPKTKTDCISSANAILSNVIVPLGPVADENNGKTSYDYTQWVLLKDITNKIIYFKKYSNINFETFNLKELWGKNKYQEIKLN